MAFAAGGAGAPPLPGPDDRSWLDYLHKYAFWKEVGDKERGLRFEKLQARWAKIQDQERRELDNQEQEANKVVAAAGGAVAAAGGAVAAAKKAAVPVLRCIIAHSEEDETVAFGDRPLIPDGYTLVVLANYGQTSLLPTVLNFLNTTAAAAAGSDLRTQLLNPLIYRRELSRIIYGNERDNIHIYRPGARCPAVNVIPVTDFKDACTGVVTYARSGVIDIPVSPFDTPIPNYLTDKFKKSIEEDKRYKNYTKCGTINPGYLCWGSMKPRNEFLEAVLKGSVYPEPSDVDEYETLSNLKKEKSSSLFNLLNEELIPGVYYFLGCRVIDFGDIEVQNFLRVVFPHEVRKRGGNLELRRKMVEADKGAVIARGDEFLAPNLEPLRELYLEFMSLFLQKYYNEKDGLLQTTFFLNTLKGDPFSVGDGEESSSIEMDDLTFVIAARIFFGEELEDIAKIMSTTSEKELKRVLQAGLPPYFFDEGELIRSIFQDSEHLFHSFSEKCVGAILTRQISKAAQNAAAAAAAAGGAGFGGGFPPPAAAPLINFGGGGGGGGPGLGASAPSNSSSSSSAPPSSGGLSIASGPGGSRRKASSGGGAAGGLGLWGSAPPALSSSSSAAEGEDKEGEGVPAKRRAFGGGTRRNQTKHQRKTRRRTKTIKNRRKSKLASRKRR